MSRIAFIGLGNMGGPMAANLVKAGHAVHVFDLASAALQAASQAGATVASTARDTLDSVEYVVTALPTSRHVEGLYLGDDGILADIPDGAVLIDCSTIAPETSRKVAKAAEARGLMMIDAPMSGGIAGAAAGTLTFIVGGSKEALERARPVLEGMGKNIFHMGDDGAGQVAKLCNNMALGVIMAVTGEALALGVAQGLDAKTLSDMMAVSTGRSWATEVCNPWPGVIDTAPATRGYSGGFGNDLMLKDLGLVSEAAIAAGSPIPLGELARNLYAMNSARGNGGLDFSSVVKLFAKPEPKSA